MEKCAFELDEEKCSALTKKECSNCSFYKTVSQVSEGQRKTEQRLDSVHGGLYLYKKYYCGDGWNKT